MALAIRLFLISSFLCIAYPSAVKVKGSTSKCSRSRACSKKLAPVCASDGKTNYILNNRCVFLAAKCENPSLSFVSDGMCKKGSKTKCPQACSKIYAPVCASDGKTYSNFCDLKMARCENPSLSFVSDGKCKKGPSPVCEDKEGRGKFCAYMKEHYSCKRPGVYEVCKKTCGFCKNKQLG